VLTKGVYWVGAIDWGIRDFHGYSTPKGTTYNAYLIEDEKVALIDTVKSPFSNELLARISEIVRPGEIDYLVMNHLEMDHSGSIVEVRKRAKKAKVIASQKGKEGLIRHYGGDLGATVVKTGDEIGLGGRTLTFVEAPMLHWPDSMFTYLKEDHILLPNDAFGQQSRPRADSMMRWVTLWTTQRNTMQTSLCRLPRWSRGR
ncbi:MAG: MBL fold metallo-hydrolase, partial [Candidatus Bathyarchaeia archaeon]